MKAAVYAAALTAVSVGVAAQTTSLADNGSAPWNDIFAVVSHPRCTNCHVGADGVPMWNDQRSDEKVAHGMYVRAGESRIGAETMPCRTCHVTATSDNGIRHAPPQIADAWRLPPVELAWLGRSSAALCRQLRDPDRNGGLDTAQLAVHLETSEFVAWSFDPGAGRSAPPGTLSDLQIALDRWVAAGTPCETTP